ncbi:MAG: SigmaK-factor processing regulatory BofA [Firmicutes bacterium]|nr:SigmaK-factor processing regulatory BofA [Bacillota bacterium]
MPTGLILTYLVVLGLLYLLGKNCWKPLFRCYNLLFQGALGALGLYFYNLIITSFNWSYEIPLNPFTSIFTGFLGIPGLASLVVLKYWIKI